MTVNQATSRPELQGRRRPDTRIGDLPDDLQPGDYWRVLRNSDRLPVQVDEPSNLTGGMWMFCAPNNSIGTMIKHTVRERDDRTIDVLPGDGSSNSILISGGPGNSWHGYIYAGVWRTV